MVQDLQKCNSNVALVHTVRRIWRAVVAEREVVADHIKGHSEDPWNEFSDVLADYVQVELSLGNMASCRNGTRPWVNFLQSS